MNDEEAKVLSNLEEGFVVGFEVGTPIPGVDYSQIKFSAYLKSSKEPTVENLEEIGQRCRDYVESSQSKLVNQVLNRMENVQKENEQLKATLEVARVEFRKLAKK